MASITHNCMEIEGISETIEILDFSMAAEPNRHSRAKVVFKYLSDISADKADKNFENKLFKVKSTAKGNGCTLFAGYAESFQISMESDMSSKNRYLQGELQLISTTIQLDLEKKCQSFQDKSLSYQDIVDKVKCVCVESIEEAKSTKIEKPLIQYGETDWEFLLRLASHFGRQIVPVETAEKPSIFFGLKEHGNVTKKESGETVESQIDFRSIEYVWKKDIYDYAEKRFCFNKAKITDFETYELRSRHNYEIGNKASFNGGSFMIVKKAVHSIGTELDFTYTLGSKYFGGQEMIYNEMLHGRCLEGKVLKTDHEMVKIHLDIDKSQPEGTAFEYEWRPDTGNIFYCMPEKGMKVSLYIGAKDEREAFAINCLRRDEPSCADLKKPEDRYMTTAEKKRYYYKKDCMGFSNEEKDEGKTHVGFFDADRISFKSDKPIQIHADKKLVIECSNWNVEAKKEVLLVQKKNGFDLNRNVDIKGSKVAINIMAGAGKAPSNEENKKATDPEKEKMKEQALEKFSRYALTSKLSFDDSKRRSNINSAVNNVASKNSNLPRAHYDSLRTKEGFTRVKNRRTPAYNHSYVVDGKKPQSVGKKYNDAEIEIIKEVRNKESQPDENTIMQKVVREEDLGFLNGEKADTATVGGFIAKAEDALPTTESYQEARESLRLDYGDAENPPFPEDGKKMYVVRFQAKNQFYDNSTSTPYRKAFDENSDLDKNNDAPWTGNGYLGGKKSIIPEYKKDGRGTVNDGAIFMINDKGEEELYAMYDESEGHFVPV